MFDFYDFPVNLSVGYIEDYKVNKCGKVKYKVLYKDYNGKKHSDWTNWMQDAHLETGASVPIKAFSLFGINFPLEINSEKQKRAEPYTMMLAATGIAALFVGLAIGKNKKKD